MKLSTRKIVGIEVGAILLWLGGMMVADTVLREYLQVGVLGIAILVSWWLLGWAKPRAREGYLAIALVVLTALVFQVVWFVFLGLKLGFLQNVYVWNWQSLVNIFLPVTLMLVLEEILRGQMVTRGHESRLALVLTTLACAGFEVIWSWSLYDMGAAKGIFDLIVLVAAPSLLKGCLLTYVAYEYDYRANVAYQLIMSLPLYILPIVPNVSEYLTVMFSIFVVVFLLFMMVRMHYQQVQERRPDTAKPAETDGKRNWRKFVGYGFLGVVAVGFLTYVGLMSGLFKYHLLAIGSGSMEPNIRVGDMVLVEKTDKYNEIEEGDVLVFRHADKVMVHRLVGRDGENEKYSFKTQGDANQSEDPWAVEQGDVIGVARGRIAAFGYPTLWLNELFNGGKD